MTARPTEPVTRDDFAKMIACLDRRKRDDVRVGALLVLLRVGLRRGEVMNLRIGDVLKFGGHPAICVRTLKQRGRRRHRVIPIADTDAAALFEKYLRQGHGSDSGAETPLFFTLGRHGRCRRQPITARAIDYWVRRITKRAGVDRRVTSHSFRHGWVPVPPSLAQQLPELEEAVTEKDRARTRSAAIDEDQALGTWKVLGFDKLRSDRRVELRAIRYVGVKATGARSRFVGSETEYLTTLRRKPPDCLVAIGVQPRSLGGAGTRSEDIVAVGTILLDIEPDNAKGGVATEAQRGRLWTFVDEILLRWFADKGLLAPVIADSGNGCHVLCPVPEIPTSDHADVSERVRAFRAMLVNDLNEPIRAAGLRVDSTHDLARVLKVHGTRKPIEGHRQSRFRSKPTRTEDPKLRELVLSLDPKVREAGEGAPKTRVKVDGRKFSEEHIPDHFWDLLKSNARVAAAFEGTLDDIKDKTRSGQDMSLISQLVRLGTVDVDQLGAILYNTRHGKAAERDRPEDYIARTIAKAFDGLSPGLVPGIGLEAVVGDADFLNPSQDFRDGDAFFARTLIKREPRQTKKGEVRLVDVERVVIVTASRRVLDLRPARGDELARIEGTRYRTNKSHTEGSRRWRYRGGKRSIQEFIQGKAGRVDPRVLFTLVTHKFEDLVYLPDRRDHLVCAAYVFLSYFHRLFAALPYLHLHGPKSSAKTLLGLVFETLGFNAELVTHGSASSMFRTIDRLSPLLIVDEAERMGSRDKSIEDLRSDILKGGYKHGGSVTRQDTVDVAKTLKFDIFCPKVVCNINGLEDVLADRAIRIQTRKATKKQTKELEQDGPSAHTRPWQGLVDSLHVMMMQRHQEVAAQRDEVLEEDLPFHGRYRELWIPLLAIAKFVGRYERGDLYRDMLELAEAKRPDYEGSREEGPEEMLRAILADKLKSSGKPSIDLTMEEIEEALQGDMDVAPPRSLIGNQLKALGIPAPKRSKVKTEEGEMKLMRVYTITRETVGEAA